MTSVEDEVRAEMNWAYLRAEIDRLRLKFQRKIIWLRQKWKHDPLRDYQGMVISETKADWLMAGEDCLSEERFCSESEEISSIDRSIAMIEIEIDDQRRAFERAGCLPPLEVITRLFCLTSFERNVLLLCFAPELYPEFEQIYAYIQDDANRRYPTPQLAIALFGQDMAIFEARSSFMSASPMRRLRLITLESGPYPSTAQSLRPLKLEDRIADYLMGVNQLDDRVANLLSPLSNVPLSPEANDLADRIACSITSRARESLQPSINLIARKGADKEAIASALCNRLGIQIFSLNLTRLFAIDIQRQEMLRLIEREAMLNQFALYIEMPSGGTYNKESLVLANELIEQLSLFLIIGSEERWRTKKEMISIHVPGIDAKARRLIWNQHFPEMGAGHGHELDLIAQQFELDPFSIAQAALAARDRACFCQSSDISTSILWEACREQSGWRMEELGQRIIPVQSWKDIVLPEDLLRQLHEIASQVAYRTQVYEQWGFGEKLERGRGISALFSGPSGTGKTMVAEVLANHLQLDLFRIDLAGVVSKYIGETEKNLKKVFDAAEQSGAILFFDEADALFGKRTEVKDSHDRYANIEVSYLLQRIEDYRGLAILATNYKSALDRAFLRRIRFQLDFPLPDAISRRQIWQQVFPPQAEVDSLDYDFLSRLEISGGNIKNIALNAAFLAASQGSPIQMAHILLSTRREYAKIDKLTTEAEFGAHYKSMKS